jgi:hypothetical protein
MQQSRPAACAPVAQAAVEERLSDHINGTTTEGREVSSPKKVDDHSGRLAL